MRDLVELAVVVSALAEPGVEDGAHGELELPVRIGRERLPRLLLHDLREALADSRSWSAVRSVSSFAFALCLASSNGSSKSSARRSSTIRPNIATNRRHASHANRSLPVELDEPFHRLRVEPEVEDRVHHPRHAECGPGPNRDEQRVLRVAEALAGLLLEPLHVRDDVIPQAGRQLLAGGVVRVARLGRDREAREAPAGRRSSSPPAPRPCRRASTASTRCPRRTCRSACRSCRRDVAGGALCAGRSRLAGGRGGLAGARGHTAIGSCCRSGGGTLIVPRA